MNASALPGKMLTESISMLQSRSMKLMCLSSPRRNQEWMVSPQEGEPSMWLICGRDTHCSLSFMDFAAGNDVGDYIAKVRLNEE